jgi:hypothetical protein
VDSFAELCETINKYSLQKKANMSKCLPHGARLGVTRNLITLNNKFLLNIDIAI